MKNIVVSENGILPANETAAVTRKMEERGNKNTELTLQTAFGHSPAAASPLDEADPEVRDEAHDDDVEDRPPRALVDGEVEPARLGPVAPLRLEGLLAAAEDSKISAEETRQDIA